MLGEENAHLDAGEEGGSDDDDVIKKRFAFALSVFYYSTGGDTSWTEKGNWLSKDHVCEWSELMVGCDDTDEVTELLLGEFIYCTKSCPLLAFDTQGSNVLASLTRGGKITTRMPLAFEAK